MHLPAAGRPPLGSYPIFGVRVRMFDALVDEGYAIVTLRSRLSAQVYAFLTHFLMKGTRFWPPLKSRCFERLFDEGCACSTDFLAKGTRF